MKSMVVHNLIIQQRVKGMINRLVILNVLGIFAVGFIATGNADNNFPSPKIGVDSGHPWRPPFGLERIGRSMIVAVEFAAAPPPAKYWLSGYREGKEISSQTLNFSSQFPAFCRISFEKWPDETAVYAQSDLEEKRVEIARQAIEVPAFEADAVAQPDEVENPVDLGTILKPEGWLLLRSGQKASLSVAAIGRNQDFPQAQVLAWYESAPTEKTAARAPLAVDIRSQIDLALPPAPLQRDHDALIVAITGKDGIELWRKTIPVMLVQSAPKWPKFGATETKLRYDAPISVRNEDGTFSALDYATAWDSRLNDVVVSLPNGARFVFWRGSCYIPFWAGRSNTGLCYEWAESPPPQGFTDCVEPLMDKELRYGRVQIVESSESRVHVRWSYQSCDFYYKVWGDSVEEDYYFYPDGFGTRVLNLRSGENANYELSEFILLTPQGTYPFQVLPSNLVDFIFVDGQKREIQFPFYSAEQGEKLQPRGLPVVYRVRLGKEEPLSAVYFSPGDVNLPNPFGPFTDRGSIVTPAYWGNHWPLARGRTTGQTIDDRFTLTPAHNSLMTWGFEKRPQPVCSAALETIDALGQPRRMSERRWVWNIGMTGADDSRLLEWARSLMTLPELKLQGARLAFESYAPERRAVRLVVEDATAAIAIQPKARWINPVFELIGAPKNLDSVAIGDRSLPREDYAWDGETLWLNGDIDSPEAIEINF